MGLWMNQDKQLSNWDRKCLFVGVIMITLTAFISHLWYINQKSELMRMMYRVGLNRSSLILLMVWFGLAFFLGLLWIVYRRAPWTLSRETWVIILSSYSCFTLLWLYGRSASFYTWFGYRPEAGGLNGLLPYFFFVVTSLVARCGLPLLIAVGFLKKPVQEYGYQTKNALNGAWIYAVLCFDPDIARSKRGGGR